MTTTVTTSSISAVASGVTPIPFTFQALSAAEIGVSRNGVEVTTGFTVILNGDNTGSVTPTSTWGTDAVTIFSKPDYTQATNFLRTGPFYPDQMNPPLDRLARAIIALKGSTAAVPPYLPRVSRIMGWDAAGLPTTYAQSAFKGANGATGSQYISGTVAPTNGTGVDNDLYFNTVSKLIYGPKAAGAWPAGTSLGGTPGNDGTNGTNGGIGSSAGNAALFTAAAGMTIGTGITSFRTAGYSVAGKGGAEYIYDAAVNSAFVTANPRASFLAADGRGFRLKGGSISPEQFGAVADNVADDGAAFSATEAYAAIYGATITLGRKYYIASGFNAHRTVNWVGLGGQNNQTVIRVGKNVNGWVWNKGNTDGDGLGSQGDTSGSSMTGVAIWGGGVNADGAGNYTTYSAGDSTTGHGMRIRSTFISVTDVFIAFFGGDGFNINCSAGSGGTTEGNANNFLLTFCQSIYNGGFGYLTNGVDVNAGVVNNCSAISCGGGGFIEYSFLGNTYTGTHVRDCGVTDTTLSGRPTGTCIYAGTHYYVVAGQYTAASTTTPGTNTSVWRTFAGHPSDRTWVSGMTWTIGSPYATNPANTNGRSVFTGCYAESAQSPVQATAPTLFLGGLLDEVSVVGSAVWLKAGGSGIESANGFSSAGTAVASTFGGSAGNGVGQAKGSDNYFHRWNGNQIERFEQSFQVTEHWGASSDTGGFGPFHHWIWRLIIGNPGNGNPSIGIMLGAITSIGDLSGLTVRTGDHFYYIAPTAGSSEGKVCTTAGVVGSTAVFADLPKVAKVTAPTGSDLLINGDFASGTGWTATTGASVSGGLGHTGTTNAGQLQQDGTGGASGQSYRLTYTVVQQGNCGTNVQLGTPGNNNGIAQFSLPVAGTYSVDFIAVSTTPRVSFVNTTGGSTEAQVDNVSIKALMVDGIQPEPFLTSGGTIGYAAGAGGTFAQATSKATGVTLNKPTGQITLNAAALAANTVVSFVLTNSTIAATDVLRINTAGGVATPGSYLVQAEAIAAGSCVISVRNMTAGSLSEAPVLNYVLIKGVNA